MRTSRGAADFERVSGESDGLVREGRGWKHGGCTSRRSGSEKENSRDGARGGWRAVLIAKSKAATCQGVTLFPKERSA